MKRPQRFLISYLCDNQPNTIEISSEQDSLDIDEAREHIKLVNTSKAVVITDIRVVGLYRANNPDVHLGYYQQPES